MSDNQNPTSNQKSNEFRGGVSDLVASFELPAIIQMTNRARELAATRNDIISLSIGEPDFNTPNPIRDTGVAAIRAGRTKYSPIPGLPELRNAIVDKLRLENRLRYSIENICVTNGAKQALMNAMYAVVNPGDEVILVAPYWEAYDSMVKMVGGKKVVISTGVEQGFKATADQVRKALSDKTKLILFNSPSNPSGAVYTKREVEEIVSVILQHPHCFILSDEIYEHIRFEQEHTSFASVAGAIDRTITVNGVAKAFAMTGWRIGYAAANEDVSKAIAKIQATITAGSNPISQLAAEHALRYCQKDTQEMCEAYRKRRDMVLAHFIANDRVRIAPPSGSFYAFPDISSYFGTSFGKWKVTDSFSMAFYLLEATGVAVTPGVGFSDDNCIRISLASSEEEISEALERIDKALDDLS